MSSPIKKENIVVVYDTYTDRQGVEKKAYRQVGELVTFQGDREPYQIIKLFANPGVMFKVFPPKEQEPANQTAKPKQVEEEINIDDIRY